MVIALLFVLISASALDIYGISHTISKEGLVHQLSISFGSLQQLLSYFSLPNSAFTHKFITTQHINLTNIIVNITSQKSSICNSSSFALSQISENIMKIYGECAEVSFIANVSYTWNLFMENLRVGFGTAAFTIASSKYTYSALFTSTSMEKSSLSVEFSPNIASEINGIGAFIDLKQQLIQYTTTGLIPKIQLYFNSFSDVIPSFIINYDKYREISIVSPWFLLDNVKLLNIHPTINIANTTLNQQVLYVAYETTFAISNRNLYLPLPKSTITQLYGGDFDFYIALQSFDDILNYISKNTDSFEVFWTNTYISSLLGFPFDIGFLYRIIAMPLPYPKYNSISLFCKPKELFAEINADGKSITTHSVCDINDNVEQKRLSSFDIDLSAGISFVFNEKDHYLDVFLVNLKSSYVHSSYGSLADFGMKTVLNVALSKIDKLSACKMMLSPPSQRTVYKGSSIISDLIFLYYDIE